VPRRNTIEVIIKADAKDAKGKVSAFANILQTSLGVAIGGLVARAIPGLISGIKNIGRESLMSAARVQELSIVTQLLGQRAGFTGRQVDEFVQGVKDAGIRTDVAQKLVAQFARRQLDMAKATDLAKVAQDAAVLSMQDSSVTLDNLMTGVLTYNKRILRTQGLNIDVQGAFERMGKQVGKSAKDLTELEKQQAVLNAVLAEGKTIAGVYAAAMETPGKQARSLSRDIFELLRVVGEPFLGAFAKIIKSVRAFVKTLRAAFEEGGRLRPLLVKVAALVSIFADALTGAAVPATESLIDGIATMGERLFEFGFKALEWGANIVTNLAIGIIKAAEVTLVPAMQTIAKILSFWMSPGSAPRIAPDIDKWGAETFTEYLRGFGEADFDVLESLQSPLQSALSTLVDLGELGADQSRELVKQLTFELTESISEFTKTGIVGTAIFDRLREAGGQFGDELAELARRQFALASATRAVQKAEEALATARKAEEKAQKTVADLTEEFNALLRAGASEDILDTKRAEFEQAKAALDTAREGVTAAEEQKAATEGQLSPLEEQVSLQERLLNQLLEFSRIAAGEPGADIATAISGAVADSAAGITDIANIAGDAISGITAQFPEDVEIAKGEMLGKFAEIFGGIETKWNEFGQPALDNIGGAWEGLQTALEEFDLFAPITEAIDGLRASIGKLLMIGLGPLGTALDEHIKKLGVEEGVMGVVKDLDGAIIAMTVNALAIWISNINKLLKILGVKDGLAGVLGSAKEILTDLDEKVLAHVVTALADWITSLDNILKLLGLDGIEGALETLKTLVEGALTIAFLTFKTVVLDPIETAFTAIKNAVDDLADAIDSVIGFLGNLTIPGVIKDFLPGSPSPFERSLRGIGDAMRQLSAVEIPAFQMSMDSAGVGPQRVTTNNFNMTVNTRAPMSTVRQDFATMQALVG
jgi:hypothetical protein